MEDYVLNLSNVVLPDCLVDRPNRHQPTASDHVKEEMVQHFACDDYASMLHMLRDANPEAASAMVRFAQDVSEEAESETLESVPQAGLTQTEEKRVDTHELVLGLLCRSRNQGVMPFLSVGLGSRGAKKAHTDFVTMAKRQHRP